MDYTVVQSTTRPSPTLVKRKARRTTTFSLPSDIEFECRVCQEVGPMWDEAQDAFVCSSGHLTQAPATVKGVIAAMDTVSTHRMRDTQAELEERYLVEPGEPQILIVSDENDFNVAEVSRNLCANAAFVHTMVQSIQGGDPYTPMEYLVMAHTMEVLWVGLLQRCQMWNTEVSVNPTRRAKTTSPSSESASTSESGTTSSLSSETIDTSPPSTPVLVP